MRAVVQRALSARVRVDGETVGEIGPGLLVLVGVGAQDTAADAEQLAGKIARLRIFEDDHGKMNRSLVEVGGGLLAVSQFTLHADTRRGNRPSFISAMPPGAARPLFDAFVAAARREGVPVSTGRFGADMKIELVADGPVTIVLDTERPPQAD